MVHTCRTVSRDSIDSYCGEIWAIPHSLLPQGLGQVNGESPFIWAIVDTPLLNLSPEKLFGEEFKSSISKDSFLLVGHFFVEDSTIFQIAPSLDTTTSEIVAMYQKEVDIYAGLAMDTVGQISPDKRENN